MLPLLSNLDPAGVLPSQVDLHGGAHEPGRPLRHHPILPRSHHWRAAGKGVHVRFPGLQVHFFRGFSFLFLHIS